MTTPPVIWSTDIGSNRPIADLAPHIAPRTVNDVLAAAARDRPDALQFELPDGSPVTVGEFYALAVRVAKALIAAGLEPHQGVCIHGASALQWVAAEYGASLAAAVSAGAYLANSAEVLAHVVNMSGARVMFVDSEAGIDKLLSVKEECAAIGMVVCWGAFDAAKYEDFGELVVSWDDFLVLGNDVSEDEFNERAALPQPTTVCKLIFTSGTTGLPKAAMLSHDNLTYTAAILEHTLKPKPTDRFVSFLPCAHITPETMGVMYGAPFVLFDEATRTGPVVDALRKSRPTVLCGVPLVYNKIREHLLQEAETHDPVRKVVSGWAGGVGAAAVAARERGGKGMPWDYHLANLFVFGNVKRSLGLDRCRVLVTMGAPIQRATVEFLNRFDMTITNNYGMSEATGPLVFNYPDHRSGTAGKPMMGVQVRVAEDGELCFRARNVFVGYMDNEAETAAKFDEDGFMRSGDLGAIDADGFVTVSGRAKELLVLSRGTNVAPLAVEATLTSAMPAIARAFAVGDGREYMTALVIPHMDADGTLIGPAATVNPEVDNAAAAVEDDAWKSYLAEGVETANEQAERKEAMVRRVLLLDRDFSVDAGELTPTMKVKRGAIMEKLAPMIARLYEEDA